MINTVSMRHNDCYIQNGRSLYSGFPSDRINLSSFTKWEEFEDICKTMIPNSVERISLPCTQEIAKEIWFERKGFEREFPPIFDFYVNIFSLKNRYPRYRYP